MKYLIFIYLLPRDFRKGEEDRGKEAERGKRGQ
jgi:hypothetical protein